MINSFDDIPGLYLEFNTLTGPPDVTGGEVQSITSVQGVGHPVTMDLHSDDGSVLEYVENAIGVLPAVESPTRGQARLQALGIGPISAPITVCCLNRCRDTQVGFHYFALNADGVSNNNRYRYLRATDAQYELNGRDNADRPHGSFGEENHTMMWWSDGSESRIYENAEQVAPEVDTIANAGNRTNLYWMHTSGRLATNPSMDGARSSSFTRRH